MVDNVIRPPYLDTSNRLEIPSRKYHAQFRVIKLQLLLQLEISLEDLPERLWSGPG